MGTVESKFAAIQKSLITQTIAWKAEEFGHSLKRNFNFGQRNFMNSGEYDKEEAICEFQV